MNYLIIGTSKNRDGEQYPLPEVLALISDDREVGNGDGAHLAFAKFQEEQPYTCRSYKDYWVVPTPLDYPYGYPLEY